MKLLNISKAYTTAKWKNYLYLHIRKVVQKTKWNLSFPARSGLNYQLHNYFQLVYMGSKSWWNLSSFYHDEISTYKHNSIFTLFSLIMSEKISWRFNKLKFQPELK